MNKYLKHSIDKTEGFTSGSELSRKLACMKSERRRSKIEGFTLVETLVAVAILVLAVTAAFSAAGASLSSSGMAKDQVVAFYLAQEAVEKVRNMRDSNVLSGLNWMTGIARTGSDPCRYGYVCRVDALDSVIPLVRCSGACPPVRQDSNTGFFGHNSSWTPTKFTRSIALTQVASNEVSILVTVSWNHGVATRTFRVRENILNWQ